VLSDQRRKGGVRAILHIFRAGVPDHFMSSTHTMVAAGSRTGQKNPRAAASRNGAGSYIRIFSWFGDLVAGAMRFHRQGKGVPGN